MLQGMTAHYLVHGTRTTRSGDTALVHAAAGGVGLLLIQMLKQAGATVFGTCSTEEKAALAQEAGAEAVPGGRGPADVLWLAGKRAGARERDRAGGARL